MQSVTVESPKPIRAWRRLPTLAQRYRVDDNGIGALRLAFATLILVSHCWPLGAGAPSPGYYLTSRQLDLGELGLQGFFLICGFLVTASAHAQRPGTFVWRRLLRIMPGFWACVLVTAFVFAPVVAYLERGGLADFWHRPDGPWSYVWTNWFVSMDQFPIAGLLAQTPFGRMNAGPSAFDGSLWSLKYEIAAYTAILILAVIGVLRRRPRVVLALLGVCVAYIGIDAALSGWSLHPTNNGAIGPVLVFGSFADGMAVYLGYLFLLGAAAKLFADRIPIHPLLAVAALAVLVGTCWWGGVLLFGLPAYAYLVLYAGVAMPRRLRSVGRRRDYSYGVYLYSFPVQQLLAVLGVHRYGLLVFLAVSVVGSLGLAVASWHLVEKPALRLKRLRPGGLLAGWVTARMDHRRAGPGTARQPSSTVEPPETTSA